MAMRKFQSIVTLLVSILALHFHLALVAAFVPVARPSASKQRPTIGDDPSPAVGDPSWTTSAISLFGSDGSGIAESLSKVFEKNVVVIGAIGFAVLLTLFNSIQVVSTGEIGIVNQLGQLSQLDPGLHVVAPIIASVDRLSTKTSLLELSNFVPTKEGLSVELDTAILYKLDPDQALTLYASVGKTFGTILVEPEVSSAVRGLTSESEAKALYTSGRSMIQGRLREELSDSLGPRGIIVEDVLLKSVVLPEELSRSIEEKAQAEQAAARMEFVLAKERQEAERKAIEAEGIADFQRIVTKGINRDLLQWKGIEATEKLAESPNTKIVIMGNSKNSLPVILNGSD